MNTDWAAIEKKLAASLNEDRFRHTLGVTYTACALAMRYGEDPEKARIAGLLHDCAKCIPNEKKIRLCEKYSIPISGTEKKAPFLLHAKLGAYLAQNKYGIEDPDILGAITWHTTGKPDMSLLEKILYIADYISADRTYRGIVKMRTLAKKSLEEAMLFGLSFTIGDLARKGQLIHPDSVACYNEICLELKQKGNA